MQPDRLCADDHDLHGLRGVEEKFSADALLSHESVQMDQLVREQDAARQTVHR